MTNNVVSLSTGVDRPHTVALITAIEEAVDNIAIGNMTAVEVYGCLHLVAAKYMLGEIEE